MLSARDVTRIGPAADLLPAAARLAAAIPAFAATIIAATIFAATIFAATNITGSGPGSGSPTLATTYAATTTVSATTTVHVPAASAATAASGRTRPTATATTTTTCSPTATAASRGTRSAAATATLGGVRRVAGTATGTRITWAGRIGRIAVIGWLVGRPLWARRDEGQGAEEQADEHLRAQEVDAAAGAGCLHGAGQGRYPGHRGGRVDPRQARSDEGSCAFLIGMKADLGSALGVLATFVGPARVDLDHGAA